MKKLLFLAISLLSIYQATAIIPQASGPKGLALTLEKPTEVGIVRQTASQKPPRPKSPQYLDDQEDTTATLIASLFQDDSTSFAPASLIEAAANNDLPTVQTCLDRTIFYVDESDKDDKTALHYAAHEGNIAITKALLKKEADPNLIDLDGYNAISCALRALKNQKELVTLLLEKGCIVLPQDKHLLNDHNCPEWLLEKEYESKKEQGGFFDLCTIS